MGAIRLVTIRIAALGSVALVPLDADAQDRVGSTRSRPADSVSTTVAGRYYAVDGFKQTLLGAGWRDLWVTPVSVPPLQLATYAGGLKVLERGGGYQSVTLH